jgi:hypothetical protein
VSREEFTVEIMNENVIGSMPTVLWTNIASYLDQESGEKMTMARVWPDVQHVVEDDEGSTELSDFVPPHVALFVNDRWQNDHRVLLRNYEFLINGQKRMEESEMARFCGLVHTRLSENVKRETVYMPYSAASGLIAANVKIGIAYIRCRDVSDSILIQVMKTETRRMNFEDKVGRLHENRSGVRDVVAMVSPAAQKCADYLTEKDNYLCYRMRRRLNHLGVPWICHCDWGRFGNWDLHEMEPRLEGIPAYMAELRDVQDGFAAANTDGMSTDENSPFTPWSSWFWRWQADQIAMDSGGYQRTRGHFCKMWVDLAPFDCDSWEDDPGEQFFYMPGLVRYDRNHIYCSRTGGPDVTMLPRWSVSEDGALVDQFDRVFEALQRSWEAGSGGRDMADWPFAVANDE